MNRQLRTRLPAVRPPKENQTAIQMKNMQKKRNQAFYHDRNARELPKLDEGSTVRVYQHDNPAIKAKWSTKAKVLEQHHTPRSYIIRTEEGQTLRRNRRDLLHTGEHFSKEYPNVEESQDVSDVPKTWKESSREDEENASDGDSAPTGYTTRYGRVVKPPSYFY